MEKYHFMYYNSNMRKTICLLAILLGFAYGLNCSSCGQVIQGQFWKGNGQYGEVAYCDKCYKSLKQCAVCKRPSSTLIYDGEKYVCSSCQANLPKCAGCGKLLSGDAWKMPGDDRVFCDKCKKGGDTCDVCGVPIPAGQGVTLEKKRKICLKCKASSITDPVEADRIYAEVVVFMVKRLGMKLKEDVPIKMVSREEMKKAASNSIKDKDRLFGLFVREKKKSYIYFLFGTPRYITQYTLAHEFTHAWQQENAAKNQPDRIVEGFAEWAAYKMLIDKDDREAAKIVENRVDDVYGMGFKIFRKMEEKSSVAGIVQFARYYKGK